jgi:hypothetical protein
VESWVYLLDLENNGLLRAFLHAKPTKTTRNEPGYESSNDADDDAINNLGNRPSTAKKQGRRYSIDDPLPTEFESKMEARMEKSEKDRSLLIAAVSNLGAVVQKAFQTNQQEDIPNSKLNSLMKKLEEAMEAKTRLMNSPALPMNHDIILRSLDYNINKASEDITEYWAKRDKEKE